ncbi:MAG TPA: methyltransferase domain-containing protein [Pyrinomonadaceae bacterium]|nr:methyltransferase domain-containing protein [Pyrinomonadaceae bacterium]
MKIDLGCGAAKAKGNIGVDIVPLEGVDVIASLMERPYPFAANSFDVIYLNNMIEHLPDTVGTMEELHRIGRPDCRIYISVVNWNSHYAAMDPQHVRLFTENSFDFFGKRAGRSYYTKARFDVVRVEHLYDNLARRFLRSKRLMKFLSFYLSNILQGLNFELRAVKNVPAEPKVSESNDVFTVLRCPHCLARKSPKPVEDPGRLLLVQNSWLVCQDQDCARKYPVYDGLPVMLREEAEKWINVDVQTLRLPPPGEFERIPVEFSDTSDDTNLTELERMGRDWVLKKHHVVIILFLIGIVIGYLIAQLRA